jgi:hypothetical protein
MYMKQSERNQISPHKTTSYFGAEDYRPDRTAFYRSNFGFGRWAELLATPITMRVGVAWPARANGKLW